MFGLFGRKAKRRPAAGDEEPATRTPDVAVESGPPFSVPGIEDRGRAERTLAEIRDRLAGILEAPLSEEAYAALEYEHDGFGYRAEVGAPDPRANEEVRAILRQPDLQRFLIVMDRHGFAGGLPLLVPDREVTRAVAFRDA